ncbi:GNAT family N-acetyltransferase [Seohaeicola saemankumensis]|nr:GNAT family N-acetyltransferase [Seohaeicola saemankumensis]MCA0870099.1 GNAT family N-acetyltransferase [Seohaeicola saemankumensis]
MTRPSHPLCRGGDLPARRHRPDAPALADLLTLIQAEFAYMDGRIDPPSSMHRLTRDDLARSCETGEVWSLGDPPAACMVLTPRHDCLYLGKLAVDRTHRRLGLAARLVGIAADRARARGLLRLQLQSRVELTEVHQAFARIGFVKTGETAHPGYDRPTSITMEMPV